MTGNEAHGDLYVYTNKKSLAKKDGDIFLKVLPYCMRISFEQMMKLCKNFFGRKTGTAPVRRVFRICRIMWTL